jgi:hypothetical protein
MAYDRPMAIDGLQRRLLRTLNVKGGFGILDEGSARGLLCRSLLWHRGTDMQTRSLERIQFPANRAISAVPSWSWMAYTGGIDYFKLDFGGFVWELLYPPWSRALKSPRTDDRGIGATLVAKARKYDYDKEISRKGDRILVFDQAWEPDTRKTLCVVLGVEKGNISQAEKTHYVILIQDMNAQKLEGNKAYKRVGAGFLPGKCIARNSVKITIY